MNGAKENTVMPDNNVCRTIWSAQLFLLFMCRPTFLIARTFIEIVKIVSNHNLETCTEPLKAKSRKPAFSMPKLIFVEGDSHCCHRAIRYCPYFLESPSTFSSCFSSIIQSFYVLITS